MMDYLLVAFGGSLGALARYSLGHLIATKTKKVILGTLTINILGAFLLGVVTATSPNGAINSLLTDGFLAAFTTFSTFMYEGFNLFREKKILNALAYIFISFLLGVAVFSLGHTIFKGAFAWI